MIIVMKGDSYELAECLARVPEERIRERGACEFFVRVEPNGTVIWSHDIADRGAVFSNPGTVCRSHVTYSPALKPISAHHDWACNR
jgi:hypothetical protein